MEEQEQRPKRFTVVGRTRGSKYSPQERYLDLGERGNNDVDYPATRTIVPIQDVPSSQVKLLETDSEEEAKEFVRNYKGDLVGVKYLDATQNGRPGF